jgi:hypothetical protein
MRHAALGIVLGLGLWLLLMATTSGPQDAFGQSDRTARTAVPSELTPLVLSGDLGNYVAVVDAQQRVLCVYEINRTSGNITLKSVRRLSWDLQLDEFNTTNPSPRDIRALVERR